MPQIGLAGMGHHLQVVIEFALSVSAIERLHHHYHMMQLPNLEHEKCYSTVMIPNGTIDVRLVWIEHHDWFRSVEIMRNDTLAT
jgi:hypothetical protein